MPDAHTHIRLCATIMPDARHKILIGLCREIMLDVGHKIGCCGAITYMPGVGHKVGYHMLWNNLSVPFLNLAFFVAEYETLGHAYAGHLA